MIPWEIALQVLKFVSLEVSMAYGWYATLSDTMDKHSGKLTRAGWLVFTCLVISLVIALLSQTVETKNTVENLAKDKHEKGQAAAEDTRSQKEQVDRLDMIIGTAERTSGFSEASARQSTVAVSRLSKMIDAEEFATENM